MASAAALSGQEKAALDRELALLIGDTGTQVPGLGVIAYRDGEEVYSIFLGRRYIDAKDCAGDLPVTRDTRFRAASVSKQFTVFTVMQLVEQGKLDLEADVSQYLGFRLRNPHNPDIPITVRMLASNTSSLRDGLIYSLPPELSVREFFAPDGKAWENGAHFAPQKEKPGEYFRYANLNFGLLGTIIEAVTGERFDKYQAGHILRQLEIQGAYSPGELGKEELGNLGTVYQKQMAGQWDEYGPWQAQIDDYRGRELPANAVLVQNPYAAAADALYPLDDYRIGTNATGFSPQGGLRISYEELGHLLEMLTHKGAYKGKQIIRPDLLEEMFRPQWIYDGKLKNGDSSGGAMPCYGLGMYVLEGNGTARLCKDYAITLAGHLGEAYGLLSGVLVRPGTQDGFIFMMNGEAVEEDADARSLGKYSGNYIWEEMLADTVCRHIFAKG